MIKVFLLNIIGWLRSLVNKNTDLRYAGKEHIHNVNKKIEDLRAQRNVIAGRGIGLERKQKELSDKAKRAAQAVKDWAAKGDEARRDRAYAEYQQFALQEKDVIVQLQNMEKELSILDASIHRLESDSGKAEDNLNTAAAQQQLGRASEGVEDIHDLLNKGPLSDVIKESQSQADTAEARRRQRVQNDNSDLYATDPGIPSMADLLGNTVPVQERTIKDETVRQELGYQEPVRVPTRVQERATDWANEVHVTPASTPSYSQSHHRNDDSHHSNNNDGGGSTTSDSSPSSSD